MAGMPINFAVPGETTITSYNYTDIAEGTGVIQLYGYSHKETSTTAYGLSTNAMYSDTCYTTAQASSTDATKIIDVDFDLRLNTPKNQKGKVKINLTMGGGDSGTASCTVDLYAVAKVRKWDGSTETELYSAQSATRRLGGQSGGNYIDYGTVNFEVDCAAITHFKKGETLRVTIEIWADRIGANTTSCYLLHDPKNRLDTLSIVQDAGWDPLTSQLLINIPFVLDL